MYNGIERIEEVLRYIEDNITTDLDCDILAKKMYLSVYEFRRIFAFIIGCPISEYIRKRRLSLAACEITTLSKVDLQALSEKYKYANQSAFTKAFKSHHGCSPSQYVKNAHDIKLFTLPKFEVHITSGETVSFKIISEPGFHIYGYSGISEITDSCCCENVWNAFYETETDKTLSGDKIYVSYKNEENNVSCCIGERGNSGQKIPASKWACFTLNTIDDETVNKIYSKIIYEWLPSANLNMNSEIPTVEVFPVNMDKDGFEWEIRIPIK